MILPLDERLRATSRLPTLAGSDATLRWTELATLALLGVLAAMLTVAPRPHLGIPGSNLLYVALPMALGIATVPRRGAGTLMSAVALPAALLFGLLGGRSAGVGALTGLAALGPALQLALGAGRGGRRLHLGFVLAGAGANALAFAARWLAKLGAGPHDPGRPLHAWLPRAVWSYALVGAAAGLLAGLVCFRLGTGPAPDPPDP